MGWQVDDTPPPSTSSLARVHRWPHVPCTTYLPLRLAFCSWLSCLPLPLASHSRLPCLPLSLLLQPSMPSSAPPASCLACPLRRPSSPCPAPLSPPGPLCCLKLLFSPSCWQRRPAAALPPSPCRPSPPPVARPSACPPLPPLLRPACPSSPRGPPVVGHCAPPLSPPVVLCSPPLPFPPQSPAGGWFLALATVKPDRVVRSRGRSGMGSNIAWHRRHHDSVD